MWFLNTHNTIVIYLHLQFSSTLQTLQNSIQLITKQSIILQNYNVAFDLKFCTISSSAGPIHHERRCSSTGELFRRTLLLILALAASLLTPSNWKKLCTLRARRTPNMVPNENVKNVFNMFCWFLINFKL